MQWNELTKIKKDILKQMPANDQWALQLKRLVVCQQ